MSNDTFAQVPVEISTEDMELLIKNYVNTILSPPSQQVFAEYPNTKDGLYYAVLNEELITALREYVPDETVPFMTPQEIDRQNSLLADDKTNYISQ
jgi:hypothetical protein